MTPQETAALNARIEREVFGHDVMVSDRLGNLEFRGRMMKVSQVNGYYYLVPPKTLSPVRDFLSDGNAMLALIAKMEERDFDCQMNSGLFEKARFTPIMGDTFGEIEFVKAPTLPHAVALAALRAVEGERE